MPWLKRLRLLHGQQALLLCLLGVLLGVLLGGLLGLLGLLLGEGW